MKPLLPACLALSTLMISAQPAIAQPTQYITDVLYAPVRAEPNEKSKLTHTGLGSGTAIQVLEKDEKTGYAKIKSGDHIEGWVRLQYISEQPVASVQLEQAAAQIAELQAKNTALESELTNIKQIAASQIDTHERNTELVKQNQVLISEKEVLQTDNDRLKDRNNQTWFIYGGILVLFSTLLATVVPRLAKRRRHDGWR